MQILIDAEFDRRLNFPLDAIVAVAVMTSVAVVSSWFVFRRIDRLRRALLKRTELLESRQAAVQAVYDVSLEVSGRRDPEQTIASILEYARRLLNVDGSLLGVANLAGEMQLYASSARAGVLANRAQSARPLAAQVGAEVRPAESHSGAPRDLRRYLRSGYQIVLEAPVELSGKKVGSLAVAARHERRFSPGDAEMLASLATQVGLALEAERLQRELQALAIQGERERIARDMHDGLAQVLGYVNTKSQAVEGLLATGRIDEARRQLAELAAAARSVYVDVREAILNLSTPVSSERGLVGALEDYGKRSAETSSFAVRFHSAPDVAQVPLSAEIQAEVFRIAREALTNVRKHARASRVDIDLELEEGSLVLCVRDDGKGFDPTLLGSASSGWPHFGLTSMRERAEAIGGQIAWHSQPGAGTEVELRLPVEGLFAQPDSGGSEP